MQAPITVLQANTKRDIGRKAQLGNIMAGKVGLFLFACGFILSIFCMARFMCKKHGRLKYNRI